MSLSNEFHKFVYTVKTNLYYKRMFTKDKKFPSLSRMYTKYFSSRIEKQARNVV